MVKSIDINCDTGEGMQHDEALMPYISSANISCGYHAGDIDTIKRTIDLCIYYNVAIGAHPSFDDKENFGRTEMQLEPNAVYDLISKQLEIFNTIANDAGVSMHHVKPHGALYNMAAGDYAIAEQIALAVYDFNSNIILYGLAGSYLVNAGRNTGLQTASEVFADRTYQNNGMLTSRTNLNALILSEVHAAAQALQMVKEGTVTTIDGSVIPVLAESICIHGDAPAAVAYAKAVFNAMKTSNIDVRSF